MLANEEGSIYGHSVSVFEGNGPRPYLVELIVDRDIGFTAVFIRVQGAPNSPSLGERADCVESS